MAFPLTGPSWTPPSSYGEMYWNPQSYNLTGLDAQTLAGLDPKSAYALAQYFGQTHSSALGAMAKIMTEPATAAIREMAAKNRELAGIQESGMAERRTQAEKQDMDAWTLLGQHRTSGRGQIGAEGVEQRETQQEAADQKPPKPP